MLAVLHPGLKLEYFRQHEWEPEWIEQAKSLVREVFVGMYAIKQEIRKPESDEMVSVYADLDYTHTALFRLAVMVAILRALQIYLSTRRSSYLRPTNSTNTCAHLPKTSRIL
jgi:hypothetical protein